MTSSFVGRRSVYIWGLRDQFFLSHCLLRDAFTGSNMTSFFILTTQHIIYHRAGTLTHIPNLSSCARPRLLKIPASLRLTTWTDFILLTATKRALRCFTLPFDTHYNTNIRVINGSSGAVCPNINSWVGLWEDDQSQCLHAFGNSSHWQTTTDISFRL